VDEWKQIGRRLAAAGRGGGKGLVDLGHDAESTACVSR
jgi:hypothetical protein